MGGCFSSIPEPQKTEEEEEAVNGKLSESPKSTSLRKLKTTRTDMARFYLKFPKINDAYMTLFTSWCDAIGIPLKESGSAAQIFNMEGPFEKASDALSRSGILITNEEILKALQKESSSPRANVKTLRFKDLILALCWILKDGEENLKREEDNAKYDEIINGFKIVRDMFTQIDVDGSGEISFQEFTDAFADISFGNDGIQEKRMRELDFNNDKEISYPEFCVGISVWVGFVDELVVYVE